MNSISDIKHILYINLEHRIDRREYIEEELLKVGLKGERFNAIRLKNGALGCSMSHLKCLQIAKENNWDHILIVEDDIHFTKPNVFIKNFNSFLKNHKNWDVVLLAGNNVPPYEIIDKTCIKISKCQTTTGYMVKSHYYDTLIDNYKQGIQKLMKDPDNRFFYALDKYWFHLQEKNQWFLITPLTVTQREDYSDIEQKVTNYSSLMTDLDKKWMFSQINR